MKKVNVLIPIEFCIPEKGDKNKDSSRLCSITKEYQRCYLMPCERCVYDYYERLIK